MIKNKKKTEKNIDNIEKNRLIKIAGSSTKIQKLKFKTNKKPEITKNDKNELVAKWEKNEAGRSSFLEMKCDEKGKVLKMNKNKKMVSTNLTANCGVNEIKLLLLSLQKYNTKNKGSRGISSYINFTTKEVADLYGIETDITKIFLQNKNITEEKAKSISKKNLTSVSRALNNSFIKLFATEFKIEYEKDEKTKKPKFDRFHVIQGYNEKGFYLSEPFINFVYKDMIEVFVLDKNLLKLTGKQSNAFFIGLYISSLGNMKSNIKKDRDNVVKIENVLKQCLNLPTIEEVKKSNRNWKARILEPFINALEELIKIDFLKSYSFRGGVDFINFEDFKNSYLVWELKEEIYNKEKIKKEKEKPKKKAKQKKKEKTIIESELNLEEEINKNAFANLPKIIS